MKTQQQIDRELPRWRGGRLINPVRRRPWRPVIDCGFGTADNRIWQSIEPSALDWFDDDSWIARARAVSRARTHGKAR
jgi:hypothetical protein